MSPEILLLLLIVFCLIWLFLGFPVAFVLGGGAITIGYIASLLGHFDISLFHAIPTRIYGIMTNDLLLAIPLFIFMGIVLEKAKIAEDLLINIGRLFSRFRGGLAISVVFVGALLAASTGIVGATVVTMGLISLPVMLKNNYSRTISSGIICASGTLGQIIPPSIVLLLLSDQISNAFKNTQMKIGNIASEPIAVSDIFMAAIIPGALLIFSYIAWIFIYSFIRPSAIPAKLSKEERRRLSLDASIPETIKAALPPILLMIAVLGSILSGIATATESSAIGAFGALVLARVKGQLNMEIIRNVCQETAKVTSMIFTILIGATIFSLAVRGLGGDALIHNYFQDLPGGLSSAILFCMIFIFLLGFFLDFIEITFIVIPIIVPPLIELGADPVWLAIMIAINLQTSFLTPPFGFSLFYLRGVADKSIRTMQIYKGVIPFVLLQIGMLFALYQFPQIATYLPEKSGYNVYEKPAPSLNNNSPENHDLFSTDHNDIDF